MASIARSILTIIGLFIFGYMILIAVQVISVSTSLMDKCEFKINDEPVKIFKNPPKNEDDAKTLLQSYIPVDINYMYTQMQPCGFAYFFNISEKERYQLCSDGSLREIILVCENKSKLTDSTIGFFRNNSSQLFQ